MVVVMLNSRHNFTLMFDVFSFLCNVPKFFIEYIQQEVVFVNVVMVTGKKLSLDIKLKPYFDIISMRSFTKLFHRIFLLNNFTGAFYFMIEFQLVMQLW